MSRGRWVLLSILLLASDRSRGQEQSLGKHTFIRVKIDRTISAPVSGRLLLFAKTGSGDNMLDVSEDRPMETVVAAMEIKDAAPGNTIEMDADQIAFPSPLSALPTGDYELQVVLDTDHSYNYGHRNANDWQSEVVTVKNWTPGVGTEPQLELTTHPDESGRVQFMAKAMQDVAPGVAEKVEFESPLLTKFWGRPTYIRAWVVLPPGYKVHSKSTYPTMYWMQGFGGNLDGELIVGLGGRKAMIEHKIPPLIQVLLDESSPQGTHEFADSANNGPWGSALTREFIPFIEKKYHMDAKPSGRFLSGHSSGGWATLQLQINYPDIFGGTWSTAPDPSDFHSFTGQDLYAVHANVYKQPDGKSWPIMRVNGKAVATFERFSKLENVLGPYGGQLRSFDWVFSPKSPSGAPESMFDPVTGAVDPKVLAYWHDHYDLAHLVEVNWKKNGEMLKGKLHLIVGTADSFYLDESARLFEARLKKLGADAHFTYISGRSHFDLYKTNADGTNLSYQITGEMYSIARPGIDWKKTKSGQVLEKRALHE